MHDKYSYSIAATTAFDDDLSRPRRRRGDTTRRRVCSSASMHCSLEHPSPHRSGKTIEASVGGVLLEEIGSSRAQEWKFDISRRPAQPPL